MNAEFQQELLYFRVLCFRSDEDWKFSISIFPEREEILVRGAGLGGVAVQRVTASEPELGERADWFSLNNPTMRKNFLEFCNGLCALFR